MKDSMTERALRYEKVVADLVTVAEQYATKNPGDGFAALVLDKLKPLARYDNAPEQEGFIRKVRADGLGQSIRDCCSECHEIAWESCFIRGQCRRYVRPDEGSRIVGTASPNAPEQDHHNCEPHDVVPRAAAERLRHALSDLADQHHRTLTGSKKHDRENREWTECDCGTCLRVQTALKAFVEETP